MILLILAIAVGLVAASPSTQAEQFRINSLAIDQPWSRSLPTVAKTGAVYFTVHNTGSEPDRLISAVTAKAEKAELHTTTTENGIASMRQVEALTIAPASTVSLAPGGTHMMLVGLKTPLTAGKSFPLTLVFEKAGGIEVHVEVNARAPSSHSPDH